MHVFIPLLYPLAGAMCNICDTTIILTAFTGPASRLYLSSGGR